jgi:hypothetical protein
MPISIDTETDVLASHIAGEIEDCVLRGDGPIPVMKLIAFKLDCLELLDDDFPAVAEKGMLISRKFCDGLASETDLEKARIACWEYMDRKKITFDTDKQEVCKVRAVISALTTDYKAHEVCDTLMFFIEMAQCCGVPGIRIREFLQKYFIDPKS